MKSLYRHKKHLHHKHVLISLGAICVLSIIALLIGFFAFVKTLPTQKDVPLIEQTQIDGMIVFTGGQFRLGTTALIIKNGFKGPVLVSGVYPNIDIKKTFINLDVLKNDLKQINVDYASVSTASNVQQSLDWIKSNHLNKILIVTSFYHIPRAITLLDKQSSAEIKFIPYPVFSNNVDLTLLFGEYIKYLLFNFNTVINLSLSSQLPY